MLRDSLKKTENHLKVKVLLAPKFRWSGYQRILGYLELLKEGPCEGVKIPLHISCMTPGKALVSLLKWVSMDPILLRSQPTNQPKPNQTNKRTDGLADEPLFGQSEGGLGGIGQERDGGGGDGLGEGFVLRWVHLGGWQRCCNEEVLTGIVVLFGFYSQEFL